MAHIIQETSTRFYLRSQEANYDWLNWFNGDKWELILGEDIHEPIPNFRVKVYRAALALDRQLSIKTRKAKGGKSLYLQAYYRLPGFGLLPLADVKFIAGLVTKAEWDALFTDARGPVIAKIEAFLPAQERVRPGRSYSQLEPHLSQDPQVPGTPAGQDQPDSSELPAELVAWTPEQPRPPD